MFRDPLFNDDDFPAETEGRGPLSHFDFIVGFGSLRMDFTMDKYVLHKADDSRILLSNLLVELSLDLEFLKDGIDDHTRNS